MLQLRILEGRALAVVLCDVCQKQIKDVGMAMVRWGRTEEKDGIVITDLLYCHKGECDETANNSRRDDQWWELQHFLVRLAMNSGMTPESFASAIETVKRLDTIA